MHAYACIQNQLIGICRYLCLRWKRIVIQISSRFDLKRYSFDFIVAQSMKLCVPIYLSSQSRFFRFSSRYLYKYIDLRTVAMNFIMGTILRIIMPCAIYMLCNIYYVNTRVVRFILSTASGWFILRVFKNYLRDQCWHDYSRFFFNRSSRESFLALIFDTLFRIFLICLFFFIYIYLWSFANMHALVENPLFIESYLAWPKFLLEKLSCTHADFYWNYRGIA